MTHIDARFAGGHLTVNPSEYVGSRIVRMDAPGYIVLLFPDEARALARALLENAAASERDAPDDWIDTDR